VRDGLPLGLRALSLPLSAGGGPFLLGRPSAEGWSLTVCSSLAGSRSLAQAQTFRMRRGNPCRSSPVAGLFASARAIMKRRSRRHHGHRSPDPCDTAGSLLLTKRGVKRHHEDSPATANAQPGEGPEEFLHEKRSIWTSSPLMANTKSARMQCWAFDDRLQTGGFDAQIESPS